MRPDHLDQLRWTLLLALAGVGCTEKGPCGGEAGVPIYQATGAISGYERCPDGTIHRATKTALDTNIPIAECDGTEEVLHCTTDADCTEGAHGRCTSGEETDWYAYTTLTNCECTYACATDEDCGTGQVCAPPDADQLGLPYSHCITATCTVDTDCASEECGISSYNDGCSWTVTATCRSGRDECRVDGDCPDEGHCAAGYDDGDNDPSIYSCMNIDCAIGRPFHVEGVQRAAPARARADWAAETGPLDTRGLSAEQRTRLGAHWLEVAAMEHASVASFAAFTFQLLALGAPADLLRDTQQAALDEVEHARIAYGVASACLGEPVGPGPLDMRGATPSFALAEVVRGLVREACVGETIGAAEAAEAARRCVDPTLRAALERIAADEARHAALAWRSLRWMLGLGGEELRTLVRDTVAEAARELLAPGDGARGAGLARLGVLDDAARRELRRDVLARVVGALVDEVAAAPVPLVM